MARNKKRRRNLTLKDSILYITGVLAAAMLIISVVTVISGIKATHDYQTAAAENKSLQNDFDTLKPQVSAITSGKFDLQGQEKQLANTYSTLSKALFGDASSSSTVLDAKDTYIRYFGSKGWDNLKDVAFTAGNKLIAKSNTSTQVKFSNLDLKKQTIQVVIYSKFDLNKNSNIGDAVYGLAYVTTTYDLKTNKAVKTTVQSTFPTKDDIDWGK